VIAVVLASPSLDPRHPRALTTKASQTLIDRDIEAHSYGDLFRPTFLLWLQAREPYAQEMIAEGLQAIVTCIDPTQLDPAFVGWPCF